MRKNHSKVALVLLGGLLFLRIPFAGSLPYLFQDQANWGQIQPWLDGWFQVGTYFLTACLIWWEKRNLANFHIGKFSLGIIILFKPIQTLILATWEIEHPLTFPNPLSFAIWISAIVLLIALLPHRTELPKLHKRSFKTFAIGIIAGFGTAVILSYPFLIQMDTPAYKLNQNEIVELTLRLVPGFFYQLGYAAVSEEPLFRGFLWGYLRKAGWKDVWIWIFQATLFTVAHIYYVNKLPISFWLVVPIVSLLLGLLTWRYRSITPSLSAHGFTNAAGTPFAFILGSLLNQ